MADTTKLTEKGQATIPQEFREKLGLEPGDELVWEEGEEGIVLRKKRGTARGALVPEDASSDEREAVARELERRIEEIRERNRPPTDAG